MLCHLHPCHHCCQTPRAPRSPGQQVPGVRQWSQDSLSGTTPSSGGSCAADSHQENLWPSPGPLTPGSGPFPNSPVPQQAHTCPGWEWRSRLLCCSLGCTGAESRRVGALQSEGAGGQGWSWPPDSLGSTAWQGLPMTDQDRPGSAALSSIRWKEPLRRDVKDSESTR